MFTYDMKKCQHHSHTKNQHIEDFNKDLQYLMNHNILMSNKPLYFKLDSRLFEWSKAEQNSKVTISSWNEVLAFFLKVRN